MSDSYVVEANVYNVAHKGHNLIWEVKSFYNLSDAQSFGRWFAKEFQTIATHGVLHSIQITHWDSIVGELKTYGLYS